MASLMNGLFAMGDLAQQQTILADQLATTRETTLPTA